VTPSSESVAGCVVSLGDRTIFAPRPFGLLRAPLFFSISRSSSLALISASIRISVACSIISRADFVNAPVNELDNSNVCFRGGCVAIFSRVEYGLRGDQMDRQPPNK
jgi:hypothetical protein